MMNDTSDGGVSSRVAVPLSLVAIAAFIVVSVASIPVSAEISVEKTRSLVHTFLNAWETGDEDRFSSSLHPDVIFAYPGGRLDKTALIRLYRKYREEKKDIRIYFWDNFVTEENRFATAYQFAATDRKSGLRQAVGTGIVGRVEEGRLILVKEYYDEDVAFKQYRGELPLDEGSVSPWPRSIWLRPETID